MEYFKAGGLDMRNKLIIIHFFIFKFSNFINSIYIIFTNNYDYYYYMLYKSDSMACAKLSRYSELIGFLSLLPWPYSPGGLSISILLVYPTTHIDRISTSIGQETKFAPILAIIGH